MRVLKHLLIAASLLVVLSLALFKACDLYTWKADLLAAGWSTEGKPVLLEWIGKGYVLMGNQPFSFWGEPTHGHYRVKMSGGTAKDFTIPSFGMCYYPDNPLSRWYKVVDDHTLIIVGPKCGTFGSPQYAVLFDISKGVIERQVELSLPINDQFESDISDDLAVMAISSIDGITAVDLPTGVQKKFLAGQRVRSIHLSPDGKRFAALVRFSAVDVTVLPFRDRLAEVSLHNDKWQNGAREGRELSRYYVGVLVMSVASGEIIEIFRPADIEDYVFVDETYRELRPLEYNFESPTRGFCFCGNVNHLIVHDAKKIYTYNGVEYAMWKSPSCGSPPKNIGFYYPIKKRTNSSSNSLSLFWLDKETEQFAQVE